LGETELKSEGLKFQIAHLEALVQGGELAPLLVERQGYLQVVSAAQIWEAGDRIIYLLYDPTPKLLKRLSGSSQSRLTLEKHQVVEEVPIPDPALESVLKEAEIVKEAEILPPPPVSR